MALDRTMMRFYQRCQNEQAAFCTGITGLPCPIERDAFAALVLHRLMFLSFLQSLKLLDHDPHYLRRALTTQPLGTGSYYRRFLRRLWYEGLSQPVEARPPELNSMLGDLPYLSSGLFEQSSYEYDHPDLDIDNQALGRLIGFLDEWVWSLDDQSMNTDHALAPTVLGFVFEQSTTSKLRGAYYTTEDVTTYIAAATIIPQLLDQVAQHRPEAFAHNGPIWQRLQSQPERYIHEDILKGIELPLPEPIVIGLHNPSLRDGWQQLSSPQFGLPNETWREYIARRERLLALRERICTGSIHSIDDCITENLDLQRFARDIIAQSDDLALLNAFYEQLEHLAILDPTCGSGAFLLAAAHVLEPLYAACLKRIAALSNSSPHLGEEPALPAIRHHHSKKTVRPSASLRLCGERFSQEPIMPERRHHRMKNNQTIPSSASLCLCGERFSEEHQRNRQAQIRATVALNNLHGVDILPAAIEICKLRLLLHVLAVAEQPAALLPLPDLDFNLRVGNALIGFSTLASIETAIRAQAGSAEILQRLHDQTAALDQTRQQFRSIQQANQLNAIRLKQELLTQHNALYSDLAGYLPPVSCCERPLHWWTDFHSIIQAGGFHVIIGNPPYLAQNKDQRAYAHSLYQTEPCGNLYAFTIERSLGLLRQSGRCGMIVPIASVSTAGMQELQDLYRPYLQWHSHYAVRPGKLFDGVDMNLTISLLCKAQPCGNGFTTGYRRWSNQRNGDRAYVFKTLAYIASPTLNSHSSPFPKLGSPIEAHMLARMLAHGHKLRQYVDPHGETLYYHSGGRYWRKALPIKISSHYKPISVAVEIAPIVFALLNSQLFYWYWICHSNCMDVVAREVLDMPVFPLDHADRAAFLKLQEQLLDAFQKHHAKRRRRGKIIQIEEINFAIQEAKPIIDMIDRLLGASYGFSAEEQDFILNYDIKYRVGYKHTSPND